MKTFKSDNTASVHPTIMQAIINANYEHAIPYGEDDLTAQAIKTIKTLFGSDCDVSFVLNGTGANVIGLSSLLKQFESVICVDTAHINVDECGAFEGYTGSKLLTVPHINGKLTVDTLKVHMHAVGNEHHTQPKVLSISQITEWGTVYTLKEIKTLADYAHEHNMYLHVDGARIANAAVSLNVSLKEMITDTGVDVLSFGGAKNGMMYGEAIVSFDNHTGSNLKYIRKQGMQLMSKMRFISAQYIALIKDDLMYKNGKQANDTMALMYHKLKDIEAVTISDVPLANIMFLTLPKKWVDKLLETFHFYPMTFEGDRILIRLVTSFDTSFREVEVFVTAVKELEA